MSDLISRREVVSELEEMCTNGALTIGEQNLIKDIIGRIEKQQTAYDVENVEEQITSLNGYTLYPITFNCILEIVRKGGFD